MDELAQDGERSPAGELLRVSDGITDAETESEMSGENNFHEPYAPFTL